MFLREWKAVGLGSTFSNMLGSFLVSARASAEPSAVNPGAFPPLQSVPPLAVHSYSIPAATLRTGLLLLWLLVSTAPLLRPTAVLWACLRGSAVQEGAAQGRTQHLRLPPEPWLLSSPLLPPCSLSPPDLIPPWQGLLSEPQPLAQPSPSLGRWQPAVSMQAAAQGFLLLAPLVFM